MTSRSRKRGGSVVAALEKAGPAVRRDPPLRLVWPPEGLPEPSAWPPYVKQWLLAALRRDGGSWVEVVAPFHKAPDADARAAYFLLRAKTMGRTFIVAGKQVALKRAVTFAEAYAVALPVAEAWSRGEATLIGGLLRGEREQNVPPAGTTSFTSPAQPPRR